MLNKNNWITLNKNISCHTFKREIVLKEQIDEAYIDIAVMGWYHLYIDNVRVDKTFISQGYTDYRYRVQYQHYDLTKYFLNKDKIILDAIISNKETLKHR